MSSCRPRKSPARRRPCCSRASRAPARRSWRAPSTARSPRATGPFVALNCAALPDQLLESELFGYEKGAFTGAAAAKPGRLELAAGGVLFLDEAGEMSPAVQAKLLRVLQEREFQRLGGTKVLKADVRVISATNRDLKQAIAKGEFREDLFYRLAVFEIRLPPLRERPEDILPLTEMFLAEFGPAIGRPVAGISREAKELLLSYPWPGNVRELKNALERAAILCEGGLITAAHLPISVSRPDSGASLPTMKAPAAGFLPPGGVDLETVERGYVKEALRQARGNKSKAAKLLGLTRAQLYSRIEKYGLTWLNSCRPFRAYPRREVPHVPVLERRVENTRDAEKKLEAPAERERKVLEHDAHVDARDADPASGGPLRGAVEDERRDRRPFHSARLEPLAGLDRSGQGRRLRKKEPVALRVKTIPPRNRS